MTNTPRPLKPPPPGRIWEAIKDLPPESRKKVLKAVRAAAPMMNREALEQAQEQAKIATKH
jgi:hypothetical protein